MMFRLAYFLDALLFMCLPCPPDWQLFVLWGKMARIGGYHKFLYYSIMKEEGDGSRRNPGTTASAWESGECQAMLELEQTAALRHRWGEGGGGKRRLISFSERPVERNRDGRLL
ncbi:transmembrane protein 72 [Lates japonicus]|uniref:Transmembrane protein 72 n=1 Tax=Lates japonicus TaxID=270547 RepID=A0AAD3N5R9_LATJO|nr:transmembrane protein 72 [Lates japonicus]